MEQAIALQKMTEKIRNRFATVWPSYDQKHLAMQASAFALQYKVNSINFLP